MALLPRASLPALARSIFHVYRLLLPGLAILALLSADAPAQQESSQPKTAAASASHPSGNDRLVASLVRTESPRQTLSAFLHLREDLEAALLSYQQERNFERAGHLRVNVEQLRSLIDLSAVRPESHRQIGDETLAYLLDILGRVDIPNLDDVPDAEAYKDGVPAAYRIPKTPLQIVRIVEGARRGEFLFSERTVQVAPRFYRGIERLPLQSSLPIKRWTNVLPQIAGPLIPSALISALPDSLKVSYLDTPVWKIIAVVLISLIAVLLLILWHRAVTMHVQGNRIAHLLRRILSSAAVLLVIGVLHYFFQTQIVVAGQFSRMVDFIHAPLFYFAAGWAFWLIVLAFFELALVDPKFPEENLDADMLRLIAKIIGVVGGVVIVAYGAQQMGVPVLSMLAGLGIGGIAIALAIRPTLENLIGGFILYIDKPIRVGDYCEFGDQEGTVETIGIRSTQIRSLNRTLISVPNAQFADMKIVNWARCDQMMIAHTIGLRYETEPDQLRYVLAKIREMFHAHPRIDTETIRVRFAGDGASSLDIAIRVYAKTREWNDFFAIKEDVLLRINDTVKQSGTGFAFPSQTLYMGKDGGLDTELGEKAKQEVAAWRRARQLPFPKFATSKLEQLAGKLNYPPRGSPDFNATEEELAEGTERLSAEPLHEQSDEPEEEKKNPMDTEPK